MTVDIEAVMLPEPMASMKIQVIATARSGTTNGTPYLTAECATYGEFCAAVDNLICSLESLKSKAKLKFSEFDRNSN